MVLELQVLGAAFGLPSLDAECLAAISLLTLKFGNDSSRWTLRASHNDIDKLPVLLDAGTKTHGYSNICHYLKADDAAISSADATALTSLIHSRAPVLISAYLYLSSENYSTTTRSAFTDVLPLYARFIVPAKIRAAAKEQTKQLGISNLDVEALDLKHSPDAKQSEMEPTFETTSHTRASLLLPRVNTVRSLLAQRPEKLAAFKLKNLADAFLEPLQDMLGDTDFLLGSKPNDVDCLAFAYLSLMIKPKVPQRWLATIIDDHYPTLLAYSQRMEQQLGLQGKGAVISGLPWCEALPTTMMDVLRDLSSVLIEQTPLMQHDAITTRKDGSQPQEKSQWPQMMLLAGSALFTSVSWLLYTSLTTSHGEPLQIFGNQQISILSHISDALAGLDLVSSHGYDDSAPHLYTENETPARIGIEIEP